jgi:hypothetical protein
VVYFLEKSAKKREQILIHQEQELVQKLQENSEKSLEFLAGTMSSFSRNISYSFHPQPQLTDEVTAKLHHIDIMDAEILEEGKAMSDDESHTLHALLEDPNPHVRARTIQVLMKQNPEEAFHCIDSLSLSLEVEDRILAAHLLGGVVTDQSVEVLVRLLQDPEMQVKRQCLASLKTLLNENLTPKAIEQVEAVLQTAAREGGWVVA